MSKWTMHGRTSVESAFCTRYVGNAWTALWACLLQAEALVPPLVPFPGSPWPTSFSLPLPWSSHQWPLLCQAHLPTPHPCPSLEFPVEVVALPDLLSQRSVTPSVCAVVIHSSLAFSGAFGLLPPQVPLVTLPTYTPNGIAPASHSSAPSGQMVNKHGISSATLKT